MVFELGFSGYSLCDMGLLIGDIVFLYVVCKIGRRVLDILGYVRESDGC